MPKPSTSYNEKIVERAGQFTVSDRNFDDIAEHFKDKIYGSRKGKVRLERLSSDFQTFLPELRVNQGLKVLDAGGGFGQLSYQLAMNGHQVVLSDLSKAMLSLAQEEHALGIAESERTHTSIRYLHSAIQDLDQYFEPESFDFIMCHAVLEWVEAPKKVLTDLMRLLKPGGLFSLTVYNKAGVYYGNLLRGNFRWVDRWMEQMDDPEADLSTSMLKGRSLTPPGPLLPATVEAWLELNHCYVIKQTGIRVLDDYMNKHFTKAHSEEDIMEKENFFGVRQPYAALGRYIHYMGMKHH